MHRNEEAPFKEKKNNGSNLLVRSLRIAPKTDFLLWHLPRAPLGHPSYTVKYFPLSRSLVDNDQSGRGRGLLRRRIRGVMTHTGGTKTFDGRCLCSRTTRTKDNDDFTITLPSLYTDRLCSCVLSNSCVRLLLPRDAEKNQKPPGQTNSCPLTRVVL